MPECHECPEYLNPKWRHVPFDETPCSKCKPSSGSRNHGRSHVQLQEDWEVHQNAKHVFLEQFSVFQDGLRVLLTLIRENPKTAKIIMFRICYPDKPLKIIAEELNISTQAAHSRLKSVRKEWPELAKVIPMKTWNWN